MSNEDAKGVDVVTSLRKSDGPDAGLTIGPDRSEKGPGTVVGSEAMLPEAAETEERFVVRESPRGDTRTDGARDDERERRADSATRKTMLSAWVSSD